MQPYYNKKNSQNEYQSSNRKRYSSEKYKNYSNCQNYQQNKSSFDIYKSQNCYKKQQYVERPRSRQNKYQKNYYSQNYKNKQPNNQTQKTYNYQKYNPFRKCRIQQSINLQALQSKKEQIIDSIVCKRCHLQNYFWREKCCRYLSYNRKQQKTIKCNNNLQTTNISAKIIGPKGFKYNLDAINNIQLPIFQKYMKSNPNQSILKTKQFKIQKFNVTKRFKQNFTNLKNFNILTYNIWGNKKNMDLRFPQIINQITTVNADFICIQQTYRFKKNGFLDYLFQALKSKGHDYYFINPNEQNYNKSCYYATILLSKHPGSFYEVTLLDSKYKQQNKLHKTTPFTVGLFEFRNQKNQKYSLSVNSLHLKSMNGDEQMSKQIRLKEIQIMNEINEGVDFVISAGDMNFRCKQQQETKFQVQYQYVDLQKMMMINPDKYHTYEYSQDQKHRFDRIYIKSNKFKTKKLLSTLRVQAIRVGDQQTDNKVKNKFKIQKINYKNEKYHSDQCISDNPYLSDHKILSITISF